MAINIAFYVTSAHQILADPPAQCMELSDAVAIKVTEPTNGQWLLHSFRSSSTKVVVIIPVNVHASCWFSWRIKPHGSGDSGYVRNYLVPVPAEIQYVA